MIVVTGSAGLIGRAVMRRLAADRVDALGLSRQVFDLASDVSLLEFVPRRPEAIIHLAAAVPHSVRYPDTEASAALTRSMDETVLEAAEAWGVRVVYASSCILYDRKSLEVKTEASPISAESKGPYARAKHSGEGAFAKLPSCAILRVSAPIGPGLPSSVVARVFLDRVLAGEPIEVWGTGRREQNYVDVRDIADAFVRAALVHTSGTFNVAADAPTTMYQLAEATIEVLGKGSILAPGIRDPREPEFTRYSNERIRAALGWGPRYSLKQSLQSALGVRDDR